MPHDSDDDAVEFRKLFLRYTGRHITDSQARDYTENLLRLVAFVLAHEPRG